MNKLSRNKNRRDKKIKPFYRNNKKRKKLVKMWEPILVKNKLGI
jgi:hypothetical protein